MKRWAGYFERSANSPILEDFLERRGTTTAKFSQRKQKPISLSVLVPLPLFLQQSNHRTTTDAYFPYSSLQRNTKEFERRPIWGKI